MATVTMRRVKLKEICQRITVGHVGPMADKYTDDGIPFLRSQNISPFRLNTEDIKYIPREFHEKLNKSALRPGDVAVVRTGYPGTACVIPEGFKELNCADLVVITPSRELNPYYLAAIFNSSWGRASVAGNLVGVAQQHFNIGAAKELEVGLPPRKVQDRIAGILSAYDEFIGNSQRRIKILESMAHALYNEWFVQFRFPGNEQMSGVDKVPKGWKKGLLGDLLTFQRGFDITVAQQELGLIPVISSSGVTSYHSTAKVEGPGVVVGRKGTLGKVYFVEGPYWPHDTTLWVKDFKGYPEEWIYQLLKTMQFERYNVGGANPTLNRNHVHLLEVLVPPKKLSEEFAKIAAPMMRMCRHLSKQNSNLVLTQELLLSRLLSGQIYLKES